MDTIANHLAYAAGPHLEECPLERAQRYEEGALHVKRIRWGNQLFVYRIALRCFDPPWDQVRWFLLRQHDRQVVESFTTEAAAIARWEEVGGCSPRGQAVDRFRGASS